MLSATLLTDTYTTFSRGFLAVHFPDNERITCLSSISLQPNSEATLVFQQDQNDPWCDESFIVTTNTCTSNSLLQSHTSGKAITSMLWYVMSCNNLLITEAYNVILGFTL